MKKQFTKTMIEVADHDDTLVVLVADIGAYSLRKFREKFPKRFYNLGICEQSIVSLGSGLALNGLTPVIHSITPFIVERCYEQIKDDFCYQGLGGNIVSVGAAFDYSALGCTHHSYSDIALLRSLPGTHVVCPSTPIEFDILFKQCYKNDKLSYFRLSAKRHSQKFSEDQIHIGKGIKVESGEDITVVVAGPQLENVVYADQILRKQNIKIEILYIHTIKPIDSQLISESAIKTKKVLSIEEHNIIGGLSDEVSRNLEHVRELQLFRMGINDQFLSDYGTYEQTCQRIGLTSESISKRIRKIVENE